MGPLASELQPGGIFGAYRIDALVGQGGMGVVFRATDTQLNRSVAIKLLRDDPNDFEAKGRFIREARLAAQLQHPGIVAIYGVGEIDGMPFIAMEWIDGTSLRAALDASRLPSFDQRFALARTIAEILAYAHARGVVHRDLKPANVMVDRHGQPKLVDFGIAKCVAHGTGIVPNPHTFATRDGMVLGTPSYMAPEQELSSNVDPRADQYSWGLVAHELLVGRRLLRGERPGPDVPLGMQRVLLRATASAPSDRYPSMDALLADWHVPAAAQVTVAPTHARPAVASPSMTVGPPHTHLRPGPMMPVVRSPSMSPPSAQPSNKSAWLFVGSALGVLAIGALALAVLLVTRSPAAERVDASPSPLVAPDASTLPIVATPDASTSPPIVVAAPDGGRGGRVARNDAGASAAPAPPLPQGWSIAKRAIVVGVGARDTVDGQFVEIKERAETRGFFDACVVGLRYPTRQVYVRMSFDVMPNGSTANVLVKSPHPVNEAVVAPAVPCLTRTAQALRFKARDLGDLHPRIDLTLLIDE